MFERFTERARQVVVLAQDEARSFGHGFIGTEHLLLGLLREEEGIGARVLEALELDVDHVRAEVERRLPRGEVTATGQIPFTPAAKRTLELALREGLALGHNYIGTEHVLLGLARDNEGVAADILRDAGVDGERIRDEVIRLLGGATVGYGRVPRSTPLPPPRPGRQLPPWRSATLLVTGWLLFAAALGIGILVGWAIWG
jgi:ATP-dependent Clp protease ATP-binding subunit ClpC